MPENASSPAPWVCPACDTTLKLTPEYNERLTKLGDLWDVCRKWRESQRVGNTPSTTPILDALDALDGKD